MAVSRLLPLLALGYLLACSSTTPNPPAKPPHHGSGDGDNGNDSGMDPGDGDSQGDGDQPPGDGDGDGDQPVQVPPCDGGGGSCVRIVGRKLFVNGQPFHIEGVNWNPVPKGGVHPANLDFAGFADLDIPLMQQAGINVVRTFEPLEDTSVLDKLASANIYVINTIYPWGGAPVDLAVERVNNLKSHPAILMWQVGNEWNYNNLYTASEHDYAWTKQRVEDVCAAVKAADSSHPVLTSFGHLPTDDAIQGVPSVDVWGANVYTGLTFSGLFKDFGGRSDKPLMVTEYGADAWNSNTNAEDQASQAEATRALTQILYDNASILDPANGIGIGGTIYSWADEWYKAGNPDQHDTGGNAPGGGPYPDSTFNEEWWGIVDIDRNPRQAYQALKEMYESH
jgi:hypothetical protein